MHNPNLITGRIAIGVIAARSIVMYAEENNKIKQADGTARPCGITSAISSNDGETVDVYKGGLAYVKYGGDIAIGDPITADSKGQAITAAAGAPIIGFAEISGVDGDIGSIWISPGFAPPAAPASK